MNKQQLLDVRRKAKKVKPHFVERESKFSASIKERWRLPRGKHSAIRQKDRGRTVMPTPGFGSPRAVRGLDRSGLEKVVVSTVKKLESLLPETHGVIIGKTVGLKKKLELLTAAQKRNLTVLNVKDVAQYLDKAAKDFAEKVSARKINKQQKEKKSEEKKRKAEEKKKEEEKAKASEANVSKEEKEMKAKEESEKQKEMAEKTIKQKQ
ncbi:MAG: eL32 family ribosomal protein [archaeon]|nr:eL32 family ribosomal protein [archaeon]